MPVGPIFGSSLKIINLGMRKLLPVLVLASFLFALISISCADPRSNCNHPKHWQWVKEKQGKRMKKSGL